MQKLQKKNIVKIVGVIIIAFTQPTKFSKKDPTFFIM